jgi:hypothetical protein
LENAVSPEQYKLRRRSLLGFAIAGTMPEGRGLLVGRSLVIA